MSADAGYLSLLPGMVVMPAGIGVAVPLMTSSLLSTVPRSRSGVASGALNTVRQASGAFGVALFGSLLAASGMAGARIAMVLSAGVLAVAAVIAVFGIRCSQQSGGKVHSQCNDDRVEEKAQ
jgi:DHA2 family methylenomycin A resistance protein-like MFS transporter